MIGQPPTTIFYDPLVKFLGLTGDLATFDKQFGDGGTTVVRNISVLSFHTSTELCAGIQLHSRMNGFIGLHQSLSLLVIS